MLPLNLIKLAREIAFIALYMYDIGERTIKELIDFGWFEDLNDVAEVKNYIGLVPKEKSADTYKLSERIINGTISNLEKIDSIIKDNLVNWDFDRIHALDKALLRVFIYLFIYDYETPAEVLIVEANEISDKYCDNKTSNYINGILNTVKNKYRSTNL